MTETVDLQQGPVPVHVDGDGPPVLLIHGALVDSRLWQPLVDRLDGVRAIRPDLPLGSHRTACRPDADLSPPALAASIAALMERLDLRDVTLVGNDTGGALSQMVAAHHPERVGRLLLTNCDAYEQFLPTAFKPLQALGYVPGATWGVGRAMSVDALRRSPLGYGLLTKKPIDGALLDAWLEPVRSDAGVRRDLRKLLKGISKRHTLEAIDVLRGWDRPALVAWGADDRAFRPRLAERLAADIPAARLEWVQGSSTFVSLDQPERLAELVREFVPAS